MNFNLTSKINHLTTKLTNGVFYYFWLGGPILLALIFIHFSYSIFFIWLATHFIMVIGLSLVYHRYFAHRAFHANRVMQFLIGLFGTLCLQRGPLWWSSHHRMHHRFCGSIDDPHAPIKGFYYSHLGWTLDPAHEKIKWEYIPDLAKFPELYFLDFAYFFLIPILSILMYLWGGLGYMFAYQIAITTSLNTIACVNSVCHTRKKPGCASLNINWVGIFGAGEGFHKNHHTNPGSAKFSDEPHQFDITYGIIYILKSLRLIKDIKLEKSRTGTNLESNEI